MHFYPHHPVQYTEMKYVIRNNLLFTIATPQGDYVIGDSYAPFYEPNSKQKARSGEWWNSSKSFGRCERDC